MPIEFEGMACSLTCNAEGRRQFLQRQFLPVGVNCTERPNSQWLCSILFEPNPWLCKLTPLRPAHTTRGTGSAEARAAHCVLAGDVKLCLVDF